MTKSLRYTLTMAAALTLGASGVPAQTMKADIPFTFHVSRASMPAGSYQVASMTFSSGAPFFRLYNRESGKVVIVRAVTVGSQVTGEKDPNMTFECAQDGNCTLARIATRETGWDIVRSKRSPRGDAALAKVQLQPVTAQ